MTATRSSASTTPSPFTSPPWSAPGLPKSSTTSRRSSTPTSPLPSVSPGQPQESTAAVKAPASSCPPVADGARRRQGRELQPAVVRQVLEVDGAGIRDRDPAVSLGRRLMFAAWARLGVCVVHAPMKKRSPASSTYVGGMSTTSWSSGPVLAHLRRHPCEQHGIVGVAVVVRVGTSLPPPGDCPGRARRLPVTEDVSRCSHCLSLCVRLAAKASEGRRRPSLRRSRRAERSGTGGQADAQDCYADPLQAGRDGRVRDLRAGTHGGVAGQ